MTDNLRDSIASLLPDATYADAVMTLVQPIVDERDRLAAEVRRLTDLTAQYADRGIANGQRADQLAAVVGRVREMADYWEQNLPEVIRTPAVVSALRAATERAGMPAPAATPACPTCGGDGIHQIGCTT